MFLPSPTKSLTKSISSALERAQSSLAPQLSTAKLKQVKDPKFSQVRVLVEQKINGKELYEMEQRVVTNTHKFAVLYCGLGQTTEEEMLGNGIYWKRKLER